MVVIEVSDTGPGVTERARAHLFEAFQGSTRRGGSGLGLAIAAELVRARTESFDPDEFFQCDCRICQLTKEGGVVIFDDSGYEDEEILLE